MAQDRQIICPQIDTCEEISPSLIKHILVPFDLSDMSHRAFEFSLDLAKKYNARISVLTIMYSEVLSSSFLDMSSHQKIIEKEKINQISTSFKLLEGAAKKFSVQLKSDMVFSKNVADTILSFSTNRKVDLIVMGTRARSSPRRFMIGSVVMDVIQKTSCPVILVK
ncbi:universal stress protein [Candidatus Nitrosotenuis uzonensis]|uniref:Putative UspA domain protein n=1 Tax=Candidatus Nitrosotenuis uzonensis TaxID=1407055 RepID=A0A812F4J8_9ARCH|nr:universal stress protein [Candidatus Nitrosotenuis uzonensis]CAE6494689.1 putative UspA domain protein [Candidatus Nitrosotenuis uzonensis]